MMQDLLLQKLKGINLSNSRLGHITVRKDDKDVHSKDLFSEMRVSHCNKNEKTSKTNKCPQGIVFSCVCLCVCVCVCVCVIF